MKDPAWMGGFLLLICLFVILYFRMKAGLIIAIKALIDKQPTSFAIAFRAGRFFYGRILGASILLQLGILIFAIIILGPVIYSSGLQGDILGVFGIAILIPVMVIVVLMRVLAPLFVVVYDQKIGEAIDRSYILISKVWPRLIFFGLTLLVLELFPLFLSVFVIGLLGGLWFKLAVGTALIAVLAPIAAFSQTAWVLMFLELVRPQKMDQVEAVPAPEIAS